MRVRRAAAPGRPTPLACRLPRLITAVAVLLGVAVVMLPGCSGESAARPSGATAAGSGVQPPSPTTASPTTAWTSSPGQDPGTAAPPRAVPGAGTAEPSVAISTLPPVAIGQAATITPGVTVTVGGLSTLTVTAQAPGETSGPAVSFAVQVRNDSAHPVSLGGVAVTVSHGTGIPAMPSSSAPNAPLAGSLPAGGSARGTYVFRVPAAAVGTVRIEVAADFAAGIAVFRR